MMMNRFTRLFTSGQKVNIAKIRGREMNKLRRILRFLIFSCIFIFFSGGAYAAMD